MNETCKLGILAKVEEHVDTSYSCNSVGALESATLPAKDGSSLLELYHRGSTRWTRRGAAFIASRPGGVLLHLVSNVFIHILVSSRSSPF